MFQFFNYSTCHLTRNSQKTLSMFSIRIINYLLSSFIFFFLLVVLLVRSKQKKRQAGGEQKKEMTKMRKRMPRRDFDDAKCVPRNEMRVT